MRTFVVFAVAVFAAGASLIPSASMAATFAECKRAAVINNWTQLINELGAEEFDALIKSCAATKGAVPKRAHGYRTAEITSVNGLSSGRRKSLRRTGALLIYNVTVTGTPVDQEKHECISHEGGDEAKYIYVHTFRNLCDTTLAVSGRWKQTRKGRPTAFRQAIAPGTVESIPCDKAFDCSGGSIEWRAEKFE